MVDFEPSVRKYCAPHLDREQVRFRNEYRSIQELGNRTMTTAFDYSDSDELALMVLLGRITRVAGIRQ